MTAPSAFLDQVVSTLETRLGIAALDVRAVDGSFLDLGDKSNVTVKSPGVLVACLGMPRELERDQGTAALQYMLMGAVCHARTKDVSDQRTAGKVAMDLAGAVLSIVRSERWNGLAETQAMNLRAGNEFDRELRLKGLSAWNVTWLQGLELDATLDAAELVPLTTITHTFAMGDEGIGPPNNDPQSITEFA